MPKLFYAKLEFKTLKDLNKYKCVTAYANTINMYICAYTCNYVLWYLQKYKHKMWSYWSYRDISFIVDWYVVKYEGYHNKKWTKIQWTYMPVKCFY